MMVPSISLSMSLPQAFITMLCGGEVCEGGRGACALFAIQGGLSEGIHLDEA